jgi:hypothetical protein
MATIYEQTPGALIPTAGRTVSTFPSGLVRVDRKYVCATTNAATHRATLVDGNPTPDDNDAPAIDGLFIHPNPGEVENGDGFTEFQVSAYGRTKPATAGLILKTVPKWGLDLNQSTTVASENRWMIRYSLFEASGTVCLKTDDEFGYDSLDLPQDILTPFDVRIESNGGRVIDPETGSLSTRQERWILQSIVPTNDATASGFAAMTALNRNSPYTFGFGMDGKPFRFGITPQEAGTSEFNSSVPILTYKAIFSKGQKPDREFIIWTHAPVMDISSRSSFGKFEEVTFTSTRPSNIRATEVLP